MRSAKRKLVDAQDDFDASASKLVEANRAMRESGNTITPELLSAGEKISVAHEALVEAKRNFNQASGGPEVVGLTEVVSRKVHHLFPFEEQAAVTILLEKECGRGLPFQEDANPAGLERIRLAVLKLSGGNLSRLRQQIDLAKADWRDVLIGAEQPEALELGLVNYANLSADQRKEIDEQDRRQYELWLQDKVQ